MMSPQVECRAWNRDPKGLLACCFGVLLALYLAFAEPVQGQSSRIKFGRLSITEGLSQGSGNAILQDRRGFVWIGTQDGLNRYDGYGFEVFRHDPNDPNSLADNFVLWLYEDRDGQIWIFFANAGAINRFDPHTESFHRYTPDPEDPVFRLDTRFRGNSVVEEGDGRLWLGTTDAGLVLLDPQTGRFDRVWSDPQAGELPNDTIGKLFRDRSGVLWVGHLGGGGLVRQVSGQGATSRFEPYRSGYGAEGLEGDSVSAILEDSRGTLWVGTQGNGLVRLSPDRQRMDRFFHEAEDVSSRFTFPALETRSGQVWIATGSGLLRYDPETDRFRHFQHDPEDPRSLGGPALRAIYEDRRGNLWVGFQSSGVNLYDPQGEGFVRYLYDPADPQSLSANVVTAIYEDRSGMLWFGTGGGGVSTFSPARHKFEHFRSLPRDSESLSDDIVYAVLEDSDGTLWVGTQSGGLHRFDVERERIEERYGLHRGEPTDLGSDLIRSLLEDRDGNLWAGTGVGLARIDRQRGVVVERYGPGVEANNLGGAPVFSIFEDSQGDLWAGTPGVWQRLDRSSGTFERFQHDPEDARSLPRGIVRKAIEMPDGDMWLATAGGVALFHREEGQFTRYQHDPEDLTSLSHDMVMGIHRDPQGIFWVPTYGGGLNRFDPAEGRFQHYTTRDGLPNDSLYCILPEDDGSLWLSSNGGLTRFDPQQETFQNFDIHDGLQSNEFNDRSCYRTPDGVFYFGGLLGLNRFVPSEVRPNDFVPPVVLTDFRKSGLSVELPRSLAETEEVEVSFRENSFSFEFAALDFSKPGQNRYAYRLEGFDRGWVDAGERREATYTNLDGGRYIFRVRGTNGDGLWGGEGVAIAVRVIPPPWKTWWAYSLYGLTALLGVFGYVRYKTSAQQAALIQERREADRLRQIDRMKDQFLANTSHELRTPLNGIIGIAESLLDGATGELPLPTQENLQMVASSGRRLSHLVDDILDFSKLKGHQITLVKEPIDIRALVDVVLRLSAPLATGKGIDLCNAIPEELTPVAGDENRLQQILLNLVGNGLKFTDEGTVWVEAVERDAEMEVTVADTGCGIAPEKFHSIFQAFEQLDGSEARSQGGTGLGLTITRQLVELHGGTIRIESEVDVGTRLIFTLPLWEGELPAEGTISRIQSLASNREEPALHPLMDAPSPVSEVAEGDGRAGTVLIVDDEPINLQVLRNILRLEEFRILEACDGHQALRLLDEEKPEIVLLDVMMPGMTGFEVTQRIRHRFSANDLPILLVTAKNQVQDLERGLESGANDYLTKPFSKNELLARMRTHLSLSRAHSVAAENRRKTEELEQARMIQLSLLPQMPPVLSGFEIVAHMQTATEVGGDYYDFFPQEDGSLYLVVGDATGHGISAGMMVSMTKSALKALDVQSPHVLLGQLNRVIRAVHLERMQMALNVLHLSESEIAVASAAMPPVLFYRGDTAEVEEILVPGLPLGGLEETEYSLKVKDIRSGDALLLLSDGLPELFNGDGLPLGYGPVENCFQENGHRTAEEILSALLALGREWRGKANRGDDITLVVVRRL